MRAVKSTYLEQIDASGSEGHVPAHDGHVRHHLEVGPAVSKKRTKRFSTSRRTVREMGDILAHQSDQQTHSLSDDLERLLHEGDGLAGDLRIGGIGVSGDGLRGRQPGTGGALGQAQLVPARVRSGCLEERD